MASFDFLGAVWSPLALFVVEVCTLSGFCLSVDVLGRIDFMQSDGQVSREGRLRV